MPVEINHIVLQTGIMVLNEPIKRKTIYIDFHNHLVELISRGQFFNERLAACYKSYNEKALYFDYALNYYIKTDREHLFVQSAKISDFNKSNLLKQSFRIFCGKPR